MGLPLASGARVVTMTWEFGEGCPGCFEAVDVRADEPRHCLEVEMDFGDVLFYVFERTEKCEVGAL